MTTDAPYLNFGAVLLRLLDVAVRYLATYAAVWLAIGLTWSPPAHDWPGLGPFDGRPRTEIVRSQLETGLELSYMIAAPSILIIWLFALASERTGMAFRWRLAALLLLPLWFLMFGVAGDMYGLLLLGQVGFALVLMRVPLIRVHARRSPVPPRTG
ncbi:hypothetical protein AB0D99_29265 [Streptomyces sp. NPDC047971]|uniref:hypothetical protein n=1 Tax=Streptomyces sp. NPDC047971 TaxID=3154499 RepID=UPI0034117A33